jgi:PAS domain S-box-containing protein
MKVPTQIISLSVAGGATAWTIDAAVDAGFFYEGSFLELLLTDVPLHEVYVRGVFLVFFLGFGLVTARMTQMRDRAQARSRESHHKFSAIFDAAPDPCFLLDENGVFTDINQAALDRLGFGRDDIVGSRLSDVPCFPPETVQTTTQKFALRKSGEEVPPYAVKMLTREGETMLADINVGIFGSDGEFAGEIVIARDLTETHRARQRAEYLNDILKAIRNVNQLIAQETDVRRLMRRACEELMSARSYSGCMIGLVDESGEQVRTVAWAGEQHASRDWSVGVDGEGEGPRCVRRALERKSLWHVDETDECRNCTYGEQHFKCQHSAVAVPMTADESLEGVLLVCVQPGKKLEREEPQLLKEVADDLAFGREKLVAEEALRRREDDLRVTLNSIGDAVIVTDAQGRVRRMNPVAEELTGWPEDEARGQRLEEVFRIHNRETGAPCQNTVERVLEAGHTVGLTNHTVLVDRQGTRRQIAESAAPVREPGGEPRGVVLVFRDVTAKYEQQRELEKKSAEMERFAYAVSHDLKSPLVTIEGFIGTIRKDLEQDRYDRMPRDLERVEAATQHMSELLRDLLELSRAGRLDQEREEVQMKDLAVEVLDMLQGPILESGAEITVHDDMPAVEANPERIKQVLQNLIENSLKFAGDQETIRVEIGCRQEGATHVFFVRDNGVGIAEERMSEMFEMFQQLEPDAEGTGMGLALAKRIIESHDGRIWAESRGPGTGTCFLFTLDEDR